MNSQRLLSLCYDENVPSKNPKIPATWAPTPTPPGSLLSGLWVGLWGAHHVEHSRESPLGAEGKAVRRAVEPMGGRSLVQGREMVLGPGPTRLMEKLKGLGAQEAVAWGARPEGLERGGCRVQAAGGRTVIMLNRETSPGKAD